MDLSLCEQSVMFIHDQLRSQLASFQTDSSEMDFNNNTYSWFAFAHTHTQNMVQRYLNNLYPGNERQPFWQPWLDFQTKEDASSVGKSSKQLPTAKWKRDRRTRPDYMRKSDSRNALDSHDLNGNGTNGTDKSSSSSSSSSATLSPVSSTSTVITTLNMNKKANGMPASDGPLDMTTSPRQRGLPPSYSQAISDPSFRSTYTNSRPSSNGRDDLPTGISMCDPIIDEHFRRSLGKDYNTVFNNNAKENPITSTKAPILSAQISPNVIAAPPSPDVPKETPPSPPTVPVTSVVEMMDSSGLSVDDHFAKALGDTWHKLNKKDSKSPDTASVNTVTSSPTEVVST